MTVAGERTRFLLAATIIDRRYNGGGRRAEVRLPYIPRLSCRLKSMVAR
jgi:hypothetical protein